MSVAYGCIVLTEGRRPDDLAAALDSLIRQRGVDLDIVVVGNGWTPAGLPAEVRSVSLAENLGAAKGRNAGAAEAHGELLFFMDDDARLADDDALSRIAAMFASEPDLGAVQLRLADPDGLPGLRHWVPRLRVGDRTRSSEIVAMCEGAVAVRRSVFEQAGAWPEPFFLHHEGIDLGWRIWDAGYRMWYAGDVVAFHAARKAKLHGDIHYLGSRNRVWLARRRLPVPLATAHVTVWFALTAARLRSARDAQASLRGFRDGLREPPGERRPLRWRTVWRMTRAGRPPII
jgi:GT2 family glycosyltransferase